MIGSCPCGSQLEYKNCCERYHNQSEAPPSPEKLMASRYCAYALKRYDYILATYGQQQIRELSVPDLKESDNGVEWCSLDIRHHEESLESGVVEFVATYKLNKQFYMLHETSRFQKEQQRWVYTDGDLHEDCGIMTVGRNDLCLCGSNKKFKKCCGR